MNLAHSYSSVTKFEQCPKAYWYLRIAKSVKDTGHEANIEGDRVHKALEKRLKGGALPKDLVRFEPIAAATVALAEGGVLLPEAKLTLNEELKPTDWFAKDAWLRSILDVLIVKGRKAAVLDWKYGKRRVDYSQLSLFAVQVFKQYPEVDEVRSGYVWLKENKTDTEVFHRGEANAIWADWLGRINRIYVAAEKDLWPARPSPLCGWCPAAGVCPSAQRR